MFTLVGRVSLESVEVVPFGKESPIALCGQYGEIKTGITVPLMVSSCLFLS